jgi:hypothetical protein
MAMAEGVDRQIRAHRILAGAREVLASASTRYHYWRSV